MAVGDRLTLSKALSHLKMMFEGTDKDGTLAFADGVVLVDSATGQAIDQNAAALVASDARAPLVRPTCDTAIYASGDVMFVATEVPNAVYSGRAALLGSVGVLDKDDQAAAGLDLYFFSSLAAANMGAINTPASSITDANAEGFLGRVSILTADWEDIGGAKYARVDAGRIPLVGEGTPLTSIWVVGVTRGTPTMTASGLVLRLFIVR